MRKITVLLFIIIVLAGCHKKAEDPEFRRIVTYMGIDAVAENQYKITLKSPIMSPAGLMTAQSSGSPGKAERENVIVSGSGGSISATIADIQKKEELSIFLGQCKTIFFDENTVKKGIHPIMDYLNRFLLPPTAYVAVGSPSTEAVSKINFRSNEPVALQIRHFFQKKDFPFQPLRLWNLYQMILDPLKDPFLPFFEPTDNNQAMRISGVILFVKDKMAGQLNMEESKLLSLAGNFSRHILLSLPLNGEVDTVLEVVDSKTKIITSYRNGRPHFTLDVKIDTLLTEQGLYKVPLTKRKSKELISKGVNHLEARFYDLFDKLKAIGSDPLQLGDHLRTQQNRYFNEENWRKEYQQASFDIKLNLKIQTIGLLK